MSIVSTTRGGSRRLPDVTCPCCKMPRIPRHEAARRRFCAHCEMHQGMTGERIARRDREHTEWWVQFHHGSLQSRDAEIARLKEDVEHLRGELGVVQQSLDDANHALRTGQLTTAVLNSLETERVRNAEGRAQSAYRSRDHLAALLWQLDELHNDADGDGICSCKLQTDRCAVWKVIEDERAFLYRWEQEQIERAREGLEHGLPRDHPEWKDSRRWPA